MKLSEAIPRFIAEADVQDQSRVQYDLSIRRFFMWVHANHLDPENLTRVDFIKYKTLCQNTLSVSTAKNYLTSVRLFYRWASSNNLHDDITSGIRSPRNDPKFKKFPLTRDQVKQLQQSIDTETITGARDMAMISLMIYSGLRRAEVIAINIQDVVIDGEKQGIFIKGKGTLTKDQFKKITDHDVDCINDYLVKRNNFRDPDPLFVSHKGPTSGLRLNLGSTSNIVKSRLKAIGLDSNYYTCHSLRHTAACLMLEIGFDLHEVQIFMRHKSPVTTQLYTKVIDEQIRLENRVGTALDNYINKEEPEKLM